MKILIGAAMAMGVAATALGQNSAPASDPGPAIAAATDQWTLSIEPSLWFAGISGEMRLPGQTDGSPKVDLKDVNADANRLTPMVEARFRKGDWTFGASGFIYTAKTYGAATATQQAGTIAITSGDAVTTRTAFGSAEFSAAYQISRTEMTPLADGGHRLAFTVDLLAGLRLYDIDFTLTREAGGRSDSDELFIEPLVGARLSAEFYRDFSLDLQAAIGGQPLGDRTSLSWDIFVGAGWRPTRHLGLQLGYRNLAFALTSESSDASRFEWEGALAGLYAGLELRF
jgi:hypothetical protein